MNTTRDESFVPLTAAAAPTNERADSRVTVRSQSDHFQPFHVLGQARGEPAPAPSNLEPRLTLQREGDRISLIRIQCTCGQTIELACDYEPSTPPAPAPQPDVAPAAGAVPAEPQASTTLNALPPPPATVTLPAIISSPRIRFRRKAARAKPRRKASRRRSRR
jgi:hypothetical protein